MNQEQRQQIERIFKAFLNKRAATIRRLRLRDLDINPFLIRLMENQLRLTNPESILRWAFHQHVERGTVTSFGKAALEKVAKVFSEGTAVEGADVLKRKNGIRHHIQVKSGPNTVPKDLAVKISELLQSAERRNRGSTALYGMCYGHPARVSGIVRNPRYMTINWIVGREFWEFISDDPQCIDEIYRIAQDVGQNFRLPGGSTLWELQEQKFQELLEEFRTFYGVVGATMWFNILRHNS